MALVGILCRLREALVDFRLEGRKRTLEFLPFALFGGGTTFDFSEAFHDGSNLLITLHRSRWVCRLLPRDLADGGHEPLFGNPQLLPDFFAELAAQIIDLRFQRFELFRGYSSLHQPLEFANALLESFVLLALPPVLLIAPLKFSPAFDLQLIGLLPPAFLVALLIEETFPLTLR